MTLVEEHWFSVPPVLFRAYDYFPIAFRPLEDSGTREYLLSRDTVHAWRSLFIASLRHMKEATASCDMSHGSIDGLNNSFLLQSALLYTNQAFETFLSLPSLATRISEAIRTAEQRARLSHSGAHFEENSHGLAYATLQKN